MKETEYEIVNRNHWTQGRDNRRDFVDTIIDIPVSKKLENFLIS
jgi:hypothetical protein